jgi:hypothetical protein
VIRKGNAAPNVSYHQVFPFGKASGGPRRIPWRNLPDHLKILLMPRTNLCIPSSAVSLLNAPYETRKEQPSIPKALPGIAATPYSRTNRSTRQSGCMSVSSLIK